MRPNLTLTAIVDLALLAGATLFLASATGCKKKSGDGTGTGGGGGGAWLVGEDGDMANLGPDGTLGAGYDLDVEEDLLAITCRGLDTAFVAGEGGTLLRTFDGGETWDAIDLGTTATLRDVAAAHGDLVYVAGDGVLMLSRDSGDTWAAVPVESHRWRSIATHDTGGVLLALADDGTVWRGGEVEGSFRPVTTQVGARAITLSHDGRHAAVVGDDGAIVHSNDSGLTWARVVTGSDAGLHAAWMTSAGELVAVGEGGTVVRATPGDVEVSVPGIATLRAVHIDGAGRGLAGGDAGEVLSTDDGGATWQTLDLPLDRAIFGLDAIDGGGHL